MTEPDLRTSRGLAEHLDEVTVLDVREPFEIAAGVIEGAVLIPLNALLGGRMDGLEPGRPVVVVCRSGQRSEVAALMLRARGFEAYNLEGGMEEWEAEGLPFPAADGSPGRVA